MKLMVNSWHSSSTHKIQTSYFKTAYEDILQAVNLHFGFGEKCWLQACMGEFDLRPDSHKTKSLSVWIEGSNSIPEPFKSTDAFVWVSGDARVSLLISRCSLNGSAPPALLLALESPHVWCFHKHPSARQQQSEFENASVEHNNGLTNEFKTSGQGTILMNLSLKLQSPDIRHFKYCTGRQICHTGQITDWMIYSAACKQMMLHYKRSDTHWVQGVEKKNLCKLSAWKKKQHLPGHFVSFSKFARSIQ